MSTTRGLQGLLIALLVVAGGFSLGQTEGNDLFPALDPQEVKPSSAGGPEDASVQALNHFCRGQEKIRSQRIDEGIAELKTALRFDPDSAYLREVLANIFFQLDRKPEAASFLEDAIKREPDRASAHFLLGRIRSADKAADRALEEFRLAAKHAPHRADYVVAYGQALMTAGKGEEALAALEAFCRQNPGEFEAAFYQGVVAQTLGKIELAIERYRFVLARMPNHFPSLSNLFELLLVRGEPMEAAAVGEKLVALVDPNPELQAKVLDLLLELRRMERAIKLLELYISKDPTAATWPLRKGFLLLNQGKADAARQDFNLVLSLDPTSQEAAYGLGVADLIQGRYQEATIGLESVAADSRLFVDARRQLALCRFKLGETESALTMMEELYGGHPDNPFVASAYGSMLRETGELERAAVTLEAALGAAADKGPVVYELATLYLQEGRFEDGVKLVAPLLSADPEDAQALNFIGYAYADAGLKLDEAEAMIRRALAQDPGSGAIMDSLGWVYYQRGEYRDALVWLELAYAAGERNPEVLEHLAACHLALGAKDKAREFYEQALANSVTERGKAKIKKILERL